MRSNKPIAELFQDEICDLLKNIRLDVIGLEIRNAEELKNQLDDKIKELRKCEGIITDLAGQVESLQEDNEQKATLIKTCTKLCVLYKAVVFDKDGNVIGIYGGTSNQDPEDRFNQHRANSSNKYLRQAILEGNRVEFMQVGEFEYINDDDRKQKERDLILGIDKNKRLNIQIPRPKSLSTSRHRSPSNGPNA